MTAPDLGFTNDETWKNQREIIWAPIEVEIKKNLRKKELASVKNYFFTGKVDGGYSISDNSLILYFPRQDFEGWDYVFSSLVKKADRFEHNFYYSIIGYQELMPEITTRIEFFDYFHASAFQPVARSRVPIGKEKKIVEFAPNVVKICENMASQFLGFLTKDKKTHCFYRRQYFFDLLHRIAAEPTAANSYTLEFSLPRFKRLELNFEPEVISENSGQQKQFLREFAECVNELPDDSVVRTLLDKPQE